MSGWHRIPVTGISGIDSIAHGESPKGRSSGMQYLDDMFDV
jgi:hypothetical protein